MLKITLLFFSSILLSVYSDSRIYGGKNAELGQFPHMADLSVEHYGKFYHLCGATIIHSRWILTAGHCAYYGVKNNIPINVTLGVVDITNGPHQWSVIVPPKDIIIHENYSDDGETAWNDIALLRIRKTVFFNEKILPIKLPSKDDPNDFSNEIGYLSGFGFNLNRNKSEPNILQYITEKILTNEECTKQNKNYPATVDSEICISSLNGRTACPGDSGSPLIVKNCTVGDILVGITSYVDIKNVCKSDSNGPVVFMRVSYFMDWIEEKTGIKF